jgi:glycerol uptake facilitator-like aquaporin
MDMPRRLGAEFFGTFWLTFAGCGSAVCEFRRIPARHTDLMPATVPK